MNIFEKMSAITVELQTVAKNLTVGYGNNQYKAVSERDVLDAVKPIEAKYKVFSYPYAREIVESHILENEKTTTDKRTGETIVTKTSTFMSRIKTVYRFVNAEEPEEYIDTVTFAEGIDAQDKGSGKAMTYADKYALMKAYKISTGDDPDKDASEPTHYFKAAGEKTWRDKVVEFCAKNNVPFKQVAERFSLSKTTMEEEFENVYHVLVGKEEK